MPKHCRAPRFLKIVLLSIALFLVPTPGPAQQQSGPPHLGGNDQGNQPPDPWQIEQQKKMEKAANTQRQEELRKETEKLLELATELKQSVDKTTENTLSLDVIKKAEQIEKLAKDVKEKMKGM
jgi:hypothetical protein